MGQNFDARRDPELSAFRAWKARMEYLAALREAEEAARLMREAEEARDADPA